MTIPSIDLDSRLMDALTAIAVRASAKILTFPHSELDHALKPDFSPVTAADHASEAVILEGLAQHLPGIPVVSEECASRAIPTLAHDTFVIVDPLDGTREFLAGRDEYTVNIGIVSGGAPVAGIIAAPELGLVWRGVVGRGAERLEFADAGPASRAQPIRVRQPRDGELVVTVSRSHLDPRTEAFVARLPKVKRVASGSAVKFCRIAEGSADLYPRLAPTCEWDVAAGHALLIAAGGTVMTADGAPMPYGQADRKFVVPAFIASGDPDFTPPAP